MAKGTYIASDLRERVTIQSFTTTKTKGEKQKSWSDAVEDVPANVHVEGDDERVRNGRSEASQSIIVTMRDEMEDDVDPTRRITWKGDTWQIAGFPRSPDRRRRFIQFPAVRTDAD